MAETQWREIKSIAEGEMDLADNSDVCPYPYVRQSSNLSVRVGAHRGKELELVVCS
jgi:hypothetical protein